jgi:hypothetical protein
MYATWNGHVACVDKLTQTEHLLGVNRKGKRISSLRLISKKGYNALHLAALSMADSSQIAEITILLLQAGINFIARDKDNKTAYELAEYNNNISFLTAYNSIIATLPIDPSWYLDNETDDETISRPTPISREYRLLAQLKELQESVNKQPLKKLPIIQDFVNECKINLERREVFKNYQE